jgi:hypothetical protein
LKPREAENGFAAGKRRLLHSFERGELRRRDRTQHTHASTYKYPFCFLPPPAAAARIQNRNCRRRDLKTKGRFRVNATYLCAIYDIVHYVYVNCVIPGVCMGTLRVIRCYTLHTFLPPLSPFFRLWQFGSRINRSPSLLPTPCQKQLRSIARSTRVPRGIFAMNVLALRSVS